MESYSFYTLHFKWGVYIRFNFKGREAMMIIQVQLTDMMEIMQLYKELQLLPLITFQASLNLQLMKKN